MDEYLDSGDRLVALEHPLSFRRFMNETLFDRLEGPSRVPESNRIFPDPAEPERIPDLLAKHGGADICYAGIGLSGQPGPSNDPPREDQPCDDNTVRHSITRALTCWKRRARKSACPGPMACGTLCRTAPPPSE